MKATRVVLVAALLTLSACAGAAWSGLTTRDNSSTVRVSVIGDSITYLSREDISAVLAGAHYQAHVVGRIGHTAAEVNADVKAQALTRPDIVVLELGTNDVTRGTDMASFERTMAAYRDAFPHSCVVATTVSSHRESPRLDAGGNAVNDWLMHHFAYVIDWNAREFGEREKGNNMVPADDVHPNPAGQAVLADLDLAGVQACHEARV